MNYFPMKTSEILGIMRRRGVTFADLAEDLKISEERINETLTGYNYLSDKNAIMLMDSLENLKKKKGKCTKKDV